MSCVQHDLGAHLCCVSVACLGGTIWESHLVFFLLILHVCLQIFRETQTPSHDLKKRRQVLKAGEYEQNAPLKHHSPRPLPTISTSFNRKKALPPGVEAGWILNLLPNPAFKCSQVGPEKNSKTHFEALFKSSEPKKKSPQKNGFLYLSLQMHETSHSSAGR